MTRLKKQVLEAESWELGCRGEDGGKGMLGLRAPGCAVGLIQEKIWDKGWYRSLVQKDFEVALNYLT